MHAYLLRTGRVIAPFDTPVGEVELHNSPLAELQEEALRRAGCVVERVDSLQEVRQFPCVVADDDQYFTVGAIRGLLREAESRRDPVLRAALECGPLTERFAPSLHGKLAQAEDRREVRCLEVYVVRELEQGRGLAEQATPTPIPYRATRVGGRSHRVFDSSGRFDIPVSLVYMSPVRHWVNLVVINMLGMAERIWDRARRQPLRTLLLPAAAIGRSWSLHPQRLAGKLYFPGRRCVIHPSAHLEGVTLGDRVRIGPNAVIRFSTIGDHAVIGAGASIDGCTLGRGAMINPNVVLRGVAVGAEAMIAAYFLQLSVVGQRAALCPGSGIMDFNLRGQVAVQQEGVAARIGSQLMGGALGHDVFLGAEVGLVCGTELPNGCVLVKSPRQYVRGAEPEKLPDFVARCDRHRGGQRRAA